MKIIGIDAINIRAGGGVTHLKELIDHFPEENSFGIEKIIIWASKNTLNQISDKPFLVKLNDPFFEKSLFYRTFFQIFKLSKQVKLHNCGVLFVPGGSFFGSFTPIVSMSQNLLPFEYNELKRYNFIQALKLLILRFTQSITFRKSKVILFLSKYAETTVLKVLGSFSADTVIIPHGISERFFSEPRIQRSNREITQLNPFRILYVSIIDMYKHQWNVIEAISILRQKGYPIILNLVGPSFPLALTKLKKTIEAQDPHLSFVNYLGAVNYNSINQIYLEADMGIFASSCENMPIILMEKMASGLPIACSNKGPMPDILKDGGLYFDPENPKEIASVLEKFYLSSELRQNLAKKSFDLSKKFSWEKTSYETFKILSYYSS
jgi:glycosyltransferase involved in cell wall biosynthesis